MTADEEARIEKIANAIEKASGKPEETAIAMLAAMLDPSEIQTVITLARQQIAMGGGASAQYRNLLRVAEAASNMNRAN